MLIVALVIGLITANYFGVRHGVTAAAVAAVAFVAAEVVPGAKLPVYAIVGAFTLGLMVLGPRFGKPAARTDLLRHLRRGVSWLLAQSRGRR